MVSATSTRYRNVTIDDVRDIDAFLGVLVDRLDVDAVPCSEAIGFFKAFDAIERRAGAAKTLLARRVEDARGWKAESFRSAAEQLAVASGTSVSSAKNQIETSKRLKKLPKTERKLREGKLSGAKARAIAAAADLNPGAEDALLDLDEKTPLADLEKKCLEARAGDDGDEAYERIRKERSFREYTDAEGAWNAHIRGTVDDGAAFREAHGPLVDQMFKQARAEGRREPHGAYAYDAFMDLVRRASNPAETEGKQTRTPVEHMALVRVHHSALVRGYVVGDEVCEICGLGPIPAWVARKMLGDAVVKLVITKGVDVMNVTHLGRGATAAQRTALWWAQSVCSVLGCTRTRRLQNDHTYEWVKTKRTRVDELDPLCKHHHDLKTYDNWALVEGTGEREMVPPIDPRHPKNRPKPRRN